jgi:hypothetical protein
MIWLIALWGIACLAFIIWAFVNINDHIDRIRWLEKRVDAVNAMQPKERDHAEDHKTMDMPKTVKCKECKYYRDEVPRKTTIACHHPKVNGDLARTLVGYENEIPIWCPLGRPEPKPLRDGDVTKHKHEKRVRVFMQCDQTLDWFNSSAHPEDNTVFFNILDLAAAVKEHGLDIPAILAAVQRGEVVVTLPQKTWDLIITALVDKWGHNNPAVAKLRKAMEE